jgi:hypothetical protein
VDAGLGETIPTIVVVEVVDCRSLLLQDVHPEAFLTWTLAGAEAVVAQVFRKEYQEEVEAGLLAHLETCFWEEVEACLDDAKHQSGEVRQNEHAATGRGMRLKLQEATKPVEI